MGTCISTEVHNQSQYEIKEQTHVQYAITGSPITGNRMTGCHVTGSQMTGGFQPPPPPWSPPPPPDRSLGYRNPPLTVAVIPSTPTSPAHTKIAKPPSTLAIIPTTPNMSAYDQSMHSPMTADTMDGSVEKNLFHFAFDTLKGESATEAVTPDLLKKPTDFMPQLTSPNKLAERNPSNASRKSTSSHKTCDTISIRSDLSRQESGVSHIELEVHKMTIRTSSEPASQSNRTSSSRSSSEMRTLSTPPRNSMNGEVVMRKDYMKSRLTVKEGPEETLSKDVLQWKRGNCLGRGSFGTVYLGLTDTGELIAVKQLEVSSVSQRELKIEYNKIFREVEILKHLKHRNIVHYLGSSFEGNTISIFTQYVSGGSLSNLLHQFGPLGEGIASKYTKQLLSAIAYLHENKVVHRDVKSGNIMMTPDGVMKLIDFGCARKLALRVSMTGSHMMRSWKGTPYWMAPEVIHESGHGKKSDIWSLGCTVYEMLTGIPPWGDREPIAAIYAIGCDDVPMPQLNESFSFHAREFVDRCLIKDKFKRPCAQTLQLHSFILPVTERQLSDTCSEHSKWVETL